MYTETMLITKMPFFPYPQQRVHPLLPFGIMGINALIAALMCMTLPETRNQPTLETFGNENQREKAKELLVKDGLQEESPL